MPVPRHASHNVVLRDHAEGDEIRAFAERSGWTFAGQIDRDPEKGVFYEVRWDVAGGGSVHYIVDDFMDVVYMVARHDDQEAADELAAGIAAALPVWTLDEMIKDCYVHVYPAGWAKALKRLGVGSRRQATEDVVEHVRYSTQHRDAPVRRAAVWAMVYAEWPGYGEILADMATDADPQVAHEAARAAEMLRQ